MRIENLAVPIWQYLNITEADFQAAEQYMIDFANKHRMKIEDVRRFRKDNTGFKLNGMMRKDIHAIETNCTDEEFRLRIAAWMVCNNIKPKREEQ